MNAHQTTTQHATTLTSLLARIQTATHELPDRIKLDWGHAEQMRDALKYTVYAAFALEVVNEDEARELGFPC